MEEARREGFGIEEKSETGKRVEMGSKGGRDNKGGEEKSGESRAAKTEGIETKSNHNFLQRCYRSVEMDESDLFWTSPALGPEV